MNTRRHVASGILPDVEGRRLAARAVFEVSERSALRAMAAGPEAAALRQARRLTPQQSAFTLIEVVISSALMAMIIVASYLCFSASISSQKALEPRLEVIQNARVAMALMTADLRSACPLDKNIEFLGIHRELADTIADSIDFATHNYTPRNSREGDFCETGYFLQQDPETGRYSLWRRRNPTIAAELFTGGHREEIATGVLGLQFAYYDGLEWYDSWGDLSGKAQTSQKEQLNRTGMPEAVRITLWFDANPHEKRTGTSTDLAKREPPMIFQTVARLNLAGVPTPGGSDSSTSSDTGSQTPPGNQGGGPN